MTTMTLAEPEPTRRDFLYIATAAVGAVGAAGAIWPLIAQMNPDASTIAAGAPIDAETRLSDVIELRDHERFLLHGRIADLVNIAGKRTSIAHLNYHLNAISGVRDGVFVLPERPAGTAFSSTETISIPAWCESRSAANESRSEAATLSRRSPSTVGSVRELK